MASTPLYSDQYIASQIKGEDADIANMWADLGISLTPGGVFNTAADALSSITQMIFPKDEYGVYKSDIGAGIDAFVNPMNYQIENVNRILQGEKGAGWQGLVGLVLPGLSGILTNQDKKKKAGVYERKNATFENQFGEDALTNYYSKNAYLNKPEIPLYKKGGLSKRKAAEILHDGTVHGKPLTEKQRRYMGWVAGGKKHKRFEGGGETNPRVKVVSPEELAYRRSHSPLPHGGRAEYFPLEASLIPVAGPVGDAFAMARLAQPSTQTVREFAKRVGIPNPEAEAISNMSWADKQFYGQNADLLNAAVRNDLSWDATMRPGVINETLPGFFVPSSNETISPNIWQSYWQLAKDNGNEEAQQYFEEQFYQTYKNRVNEGNKNLRDIHRGTEFELPPMNAFGGVLSFGQGGLSYVDDSEVVIPMDNQMAMPVKGGSLKPIGDNMYEVDSNQGGTDDVLMHSGKAKIISADNGLARLVKNKQKEVEVIKGKIEKQQKLLEKKDLTSLSRKSIGSNLANLMKVMEEKQNEVQQLIDMQPNYEGESGMYDGGIIESDNIKGKTPQKTKDEIRQMLKEHRKAMRGAAVKLKAPKLSFGQSASVKGGFGGNSVGTQGPKCMGGNCKQDGGITQRKELPYPITGDNIEEAYNTAMRNHRKNMSGWIYDLIPNYYYDLPMMRDSAYETYIPPDKLGPIKTSEGHTLPYRNVVDTAKMKEYGYTPREKIVIDAMYPLMHNQRVIKKPAANVKKYSRGTLNNQPRLTWTSPSDESVSYPIDNSGRSESFMNFMQSNDSIIPITQGTYGLANLIYGLSSPVDKLEVDQIPTIGRAKEIAPITSTADRYLTGTPMGYSGLGLSPSAIYQAMANNMSQYNDARMKEISMNKEIESRNREMEFNTSRTNADIFSQNIRNDMYRQSYNAQAEAARKQTISQGAADTVAALAKILSYTGLFSQ